MALGDSNAGTPPNTAVNNEWIASNHIVDTLDKTYTKNGKNTITKSNMGDDGIPARVKYQDYWKDSNQIYHIKEADMHFNIYYPWANSKQVGKFFIKDVATHEFGHIFLLDEVYSPYTDRSMYQDVNYNEDFRVTLHSDDIAGAKASVARW